MDPRLGIIRNNDTERIVCVELVDECLLLVIQIHAARLAGVGIKLHRIEGERTHDSVGAVGNKDDNLGHEILEFQA